MPSYLLLADQPTTAHAWVHATAALSNHGNQSYNLVYSVTSPLVLAEGAREVIRVFDVFASEYNLRSTETVASTIFPLDTYRSQGSDAFYDYYIERNISEGSQAVGILL